MDEAAVKPRLRIGVVSMDAMRFEGLREALEETAELLPLTAHSTLREEDLAMLLLDGQDDHLMTLMATIRRARPALRLIVLGSSNDPRHIQTVVAGGAKGYLPYTAQPVEVRMAVSVVHDGSIWAPRRVLASLIDTYAPQAPRVVSMRLTKREREVVELLIAGRANREIGATLGIEVKTVKTHVSRLLQKFGVPNRVALTVRALEMEILSD